MSGIWGLEFGIWDFNFFRFGNRFRQNKASHTHANALRSFPPAGVRLVPGDKVTLKTEYFGYTPVFDSTSIYSVFAVDEYQEVSVSADYRLGRMWTLFGSYTREMYESFDDANVIEAGAELRRKGGYGGYVAAVYRSGEEELKGLKAAYRMAAPYDVRLGVGAEYNVYSRIDDDDLQWLERYRLR